MMEVKKKEIVDHLPIEIIAEILSWLPVKSLLRFKCVCKSWHNLINNPDFSKLHVSRSLEVNTDGTFILFDDSYSLHRVNFHTGFSCFSTQLHLPRKIKQRGASLVGSCRGLLCFKWWHSELICWALYNPATRAYKQLPALRKEFLSNNQRIDFAYDCVGDDYKVLWNFNRFDTMIGRVVEENYLYSLKTDLWEIIPNPPLDSSYSGSHGVFTNNSLHWLHYQNDINGVQMVMCFDLFTQKYKEMALPREATAPAMKLVMLRGQLHVVVPQLDIWVMKEYGVTESWTQLFHCSPTQHEKIPHSIELWFLAFPLAYSKDGRKILVKVGIRSKSLYCCDLEYQAISKVKLMPGLPNEVASFDAKPWVESLISPGHM